MHNAFWKSWSFRSWIAIGFAIAILPLAIAGSAGYVILDRWAAQPSQRVLLQAHTRLEPIHDLRVELGTAVLSLDESLHGSGRSYWASYEDSAAQILSIFSAVRVDAAGDAALMDLVDTAQSAWNEADRLARRAHALSEQGLEIPEDDVSDIHARFLSAHEPLSAAHDLITAELDSLFATALRSYGITRQLSISAAAVALVFVVLGVLIIGRIMSISIQRLIEGALRFADGDRDHRIDVPLPPELKRAAEEFNRMISRIDDAEEELARLARVDPLTQLYNRRAFDEHLETASARLKRLGWSMALLVIDIDHFKVINDSIGHTGGDQVLKRVAGAIRGNIRETDIPCRIGGEEFVVLMPECGQEDASAMAERLRTAIGALQVRLEDETTTLVTVSIGLALATRPIEAEALLQRADKALYRAKQGGRNRVECAEPLTPRIVSST